MVTNFVCTYFTTEIFLDVEMYSEGIQGTANYRRGNFEE